MFFSGFSVFIFILIYFRDVVTPKPS